MSDNELLLALSNMIGLKLKPINDRLKRIEITQEKEILSRLQNIKSCYTLTYGNSVSDYEAMKQNIEIMKK